MTQKEYNEFKAAEKLAVEFGIKRDQNERSAFITITMYRDIATVVCGGSPEEVCTAIVAAMLEDEVIADIIRIANKVYAQQIANKEE